MTQAILMSDRSTRNLRVTGWSLAALLLLAPVVAMQFEASGVNWSAGDFIFAGTMFAIVGGLFELAARASKSLAYRAAVVLAVASCFLQVWINLAVGIIGNEDDPANITYFVVVLVAICTAVVARGEARLMARATLVALVVQAMFCAVHLIEGHFTVVIDLFFAALWLLSSRLFARASNESVAA
jgi:hypothetical protein